MEKNKSKDNLKVANFRLSLDDLKAIDKKGIGKSSSEKLRSIISKFRTEKITPIKRRKAYKKIFPFSFEEGDSSFKEMKQNWDNTNKKDFLLKGNLRNDLKQRAEMAKRRAIEMSNYYEEIKKMGWFIQQIIFKWEKDELVQYDISLSKENFEIILQVTLEGEEFIIKQQGVIQEDNIEDIEYISLEEEDNLSYFYDEIQKELFKPEKNEIHTQEFIKKYSNGDIYMAVEYGDIVIAELEYSNLSKKVVLTALKGL